MKNLSHSVAFGREVFTFFDKFLNKNQIVIWKDDSKFFAYWFDGFVLKEYRRILPRKFDWNTFVISTFNSIVLGRKKPFVQRKALYYDNNKTLFLRYVVL